MLKIVRDPEICKLYSRDDSSHEGLADGVFFAHSTEDVKNILKYCYKKKIPVTARGKGTGTPGGAVPIQGGIVLSLEKMNSIIDYNPLDRYIKVQTGILNQAVQTKVSKNNFCWAPDPGSAANCTVGGNIAYNTAGPRAVKYGAVRENILGLTAVTGTGEVIHTGGYTTKSAVAYDLTRLLIGSEGTLAIITEAILKLTPLPLHTVTFQLNYSHIKFAIKAVINIMAQSVLPEALELLDNTAAGLINIKASAVLLVKVTSRDRNAILSAATNTGLVFSRVYNAVWEKRKMLSPALKTLSPYKINEDVVVPISKIPELFNFLKNLGKKYNIPIVNFGHVGNGNIHVNLLIPRNAASIKILETLFDKIISLNGTLSGEHGIGLEKKPYITKAIDPASLAIMKNIKKIFDPNNILNPGKIF